MGNDDKIFFDPLLPYEDMRVPDKVLRSVVFLGMKNGDTQPRLAGTGFFVAVPTVNFHGLHHTYLVTAKHVYVKMKEAVEKGHAVFARQNLRNGNFYDTDLKDMSSWLFHPTESDRVDVAVRRAAIHENTVEDIPIIIDTFLSHKQLRAKGIGIGDEIFCPGLFHPVPGEKKKLPIVRVGNVAMMPEGREVYSPEFAGKIEAYLIESRSIKGLSGSPVFVRPSDDRFYGFGLISGHYDVKKQPDINNLLLDDEGLLNTGISIVTPAGKIIETLMQPELQKARQEMEQNSFE